MLHATLPLCFVYLESIQTQDYHSMLAPDAWKICGRVNKVIACTGLEPDEFVEDMKKKGIRVPGIGHRIKSKVRPGSLL